MFPLHALNAQEVAEAVRRFRAYERTTSSIGGMVTDFRYFPKAHLLCSWIEDLARQPRILDAVASLLGPDLLLWSSQFLVSAAGDTEHHPWHQDGLDYGIQGFEQGALRVSLALTPLTARGGTLSFVPMSHAEGFAPHRRVCGFEGTAFAFAEEADLDHGAAEEVTAELKVGEFALHHWATLKRLAPNQTSADRIILSFDYITPWVTPTGPRDSALLIRGQDHHGNFEHESPASDEFAPETLHRFRQATMTRLRRLVTLANLRRGETAG